MCQYINHPTYSSNRNKSATNHVANYTTPTNMTFECKDLAYHNYLINNAKYWKLFSQIIDVVYTDLPKAFDKCEYGVIAYKLRQNGILGGKIGGWIYNNFLVGRT